MRMHMHTALPRLPPLCVFKWCPDRAQHTLAVVRGGRRDVVNVMVRRFGLHVVEAGLRGFALQPRLMARLL